MAEAKNPSNVEKVGLVKGLKLLRTNGITVDQITTNRHSEIRKHLRANEKDTIHQFLNVSKDGFGNCDAFTSR